MSQANVEIVRAFFQAWNTGNMDALRELHDPDAIGRPPEGWPGEDFRVMTDQYLELDGERVLALSRYSGRGKTSGLDLSQTRTKAALLFHVRDCKVTRIVSYWDRDSALADLGLSEQDARADS